MFFRNPVTPFTIIFKMNIKNTTSSPPTLLSENMVAKWLGFF